MQLSEKLYNRSQARQFYCQKLVFGARQMEFATFMLQSCFLDTSYSESNFQSKSEMQKELLRRFQRKSPQPTAGIHHVLSEESYGSSLETTALLQRKDIVPSCSPIYTKLKKLFGDQKGRKEEQEDQICTNPMLVLIDLTGKFDFIFTERKGH